MSKPVPYAVITALLIAIIAVFVNNPFTGPVEEYVPSAQGQNNTALFIVLPHHGLSNVHLATADALLERHPDIKLEFASFPELKGKVDRISSWGKGRNSAAKPIGFHPISGRGYEDIIAERLETTRGEIDATESVMTLRGVAGIRKVTKDFSCYIAPWPAEEHLEIYQHVKGIIDELDPAVVVLDTLFSPAMDAAREGNRLHAIITPNTLIDNFPGEQPWGGMFWKYPVMGSGHPFPLPWSLVPSNIYQAIRFIMGVLHSPDLRAKRDYLKQHGLKKPIDFFHIHRPDVPWITQTMPGASVPVDVTPQNVSAVGPIVISVAPVQEQDPELSAWLEQRPTVFINLGSSVKYNEGRATVMVAAIKQVLDQNSRVQILWKMTKWGVYSDDFSLPVQEHITSGRLRLSGWLNADPPSILESGHVVAAVHHGGANCYHEAVAAGVPHVILPLWMDLYNFAALVESLDLGVWGCPQTSPFWTPECISEAVLKVVNSSDASESMRRNAQVLSVEAQKDPGRYASARIIAQLAGSGY